MAADYFCDDRDDFLEKIFLEVKEFCDEFKKTVKVCSCESYWMNN